MNLPKAPPAYSLPSLDATTLKELLSKATSGTWQPCSCGKCGLIWNLERDALLLSTSTVDDDVPYTPKEDIPHNRDLIAYLVNHAPEIVKMLEAREKST